MAINIHLGYMKLKETGTNRILGYYKDDIGWTNIQGNTTKEFITKIKKDIDLADKEIKFYKKAIPYFKTTVPPIKPLDKQTYEEIKELYSKINQQQTTNN